ncbi:fatty acid desaturase [Aminobacter sp. NyZ550]|uniref:fatty acid desaturase n=1 Tax=Aminobacter sp. NyZ550 TaxID=2979870 RepID=UPI0021D5EA99|nr:fatty acid desaturase [Aminobacter sp. NyZ550]WAX96251.1 fatty acid desaturase [Aminobacter sp. NyZ550]
MTKLMSSKADDLPKGSAQGADHAAEKALVRRLASHCNRFRDPDDRRAAFELAVTLTPFLMMGAALVWLATYAGPLLGGWRWLLMVALAPVCASFLVRLFAIQHDCGHGSFTSSRMANKTIGRALSVFTFTPYTLWQKAHAVHHGGSGNLDKRGIGDIDTRTVAEYEAMTTSQRLMYRIYRNPIILIVIGVPIYFLIMHRLPYNDAIPRVEAWRSAGGLNVALVLVYGGLVLLAGWAVMLAVLPVVVMGAWAGGWLFYVQHQFEETRWDAGDAWDLHVAAFGGSSWYALPAVAQWITGSIGLHHIHHLCSRVPFYRLQACFDSNAELRDASQTVKLTFWKSVGCVNLALWCEDRRRLVTFAEARV